MRLSLPGQTAKPRRGFTLVELLIALAIIGTLAAIATLAWSKYRDYATNSQAEADMVSIENRIEVYLLGNNTYPPDLAAIGMGSLLDPWGHPYQYLNIANGNKEEDEGAQRKDRNLVPINSDYDLYSMGPDGQSRPPLTAKASRDDIIRANDGKYLGPASNY